MRRLLLLPLCFAVSYAVIRPITRFRRVNTMERTGVGLEHGHYCGRETTVHRFARDLYNLYRGRRTFRSSKYRTIYEHGLPQTQYCNLRDPDSPINIIYHDDRPMALKEQFMDILLKAGVPPKFASKALAHISESSSKNALGNHQLKQRLQRAVRENPETMAYIKAIYHFDYEIYCNLKKEAHEYFLIRHTTDKQALAKQFLQLFETANIPKHYAEKSFTSKRLCELAAMLRFLLSTFKRLHKHAFNPFEDTLETADDPAIIYSNITQPVDHFDDKLTDIWQQQYQYNPKFYTKDRPLIFLMLGGEGPIGGGGDKWIKNENVSMMRWAKEFGAAAMQVEHRFYGNSRPYPQQTTANLKFLTVKQVLADIKEFITQMNKMYFNDVTPRWITFGGSYPGSLSAWFRETYPEMTIGAVSTSSAVNTRVDYYGYAVNTEKNYRKNSDACGDAIGAAFNQIINALYTDDAARKSLQQDLPTTIDFTIGDKVPIARQVQYFFSSLYGIFQGINQYSGDNRNVNSDAGEGIPKACELMTDKNGNAYSNLLNLVKWDNGLNGAPKVDNDYASFVANMQKTDYSDEGWASYRTWVWQTCTFLGYFQTTDGGNSGIFGSIIPLDFYVDQCIDIFGKDYIADTVYAGVEQNQKDYGGDKNYRGTKVVFPNGSIDPWWSLGKLTPNNASDVDAFTIEGTAHCADMYPWRDNDLQSLKDGRMTREISAIKVFRIHLKPLEQQPHQLHQRLRQPTTSALFCWPSSALLLLFVFNE
ncbi:unnamed protein product, partial [Mesorhabditis spiculigera]